MEKILNLYVAGIISFQDTVHAIKMMPDLSLDEKLEAISNISAEIIVNYLIVK